jgi:ABC-type transport system involved in multi-copper enzyme maturation permease subunit
VALVFRHSWQKLLGPMVFYDLVRTTRRGRHIVFRCVYAGALLVWFFVFYSAWLARSGDPWDAALRGGTIQIGQIPAFAQSFFLTFMAVQYVAVLLLTPVFVTGAISEEREMGTLRLLLSTELTSREIVLGKLVSRLVSLTLLLATGLPILSLTQFLGGVDPQQVLLGFAATALTMLSLGSLSLLVSIITARPEDCIFRTYFWTALFLSVGAFLPPFICGNPITMMFLLRDARVLQYSDSSTAGVTSLPLGLLASCYILFHALAAVALCWISILALDRFRRAEPKKAPPPLEPIEEGEGRKMSVATIRAPQEAKPSPVLSDLPPVTDRPMLWKEQYFGQEFRFKRLGLLLLFPIGPAVFILLVLLLNIISDSYGTGTLGEQVNLWVKGAGTSLACVMLLLVAFFAASSVSQEREWETLASLLSTPLERDEILLAKWFASLRGVRELAWCVGTVWAVGLLTGGLHPLAVPLLVLSWGVFAAFTASLGLFLSIICRSTQRATIVTLVVCLFLGAGPWLLAGEGKVVLTPPAILNALTFGYKIDREAIVVALAWLPCYGAAAWALWTLSCSRFKH